MLIGMLKLGPGVLINYSKVILQLIWDPGSQSKATIFRNITTMPWMEHQYITGSQILLTWSATEFRRGVGLYLRFGLCDQNSGMDPLVCKEQKMKKRKKDINITD